MSSILRIEELSKGYINKKALDDISIEIERGKIVGVLGPNGSGKTTLIKLITGLIKPTSGKVFIDEHEPDVYTKSIVAYLPDRPFLYKWMKIKDAIQFYKDFYKDFSEKKALELLEFMNLDLESKVTNLSKGMMEKLNLTLTLSRKAKLYILDEPLGGVDPTTREKILDAIIENYSKDSSMIITTHLVQDIERLFDDVIFISDGKIILSGNAEDLRIEKGKSIDEIYREVFK